jgi:hypothetical protein
VRTAFGKGEGDGGLFSAIFPRPNEKGWPRLATVDEELRALCAGLWGAEAVPCSPCLAYREVESRYGRR